MPSSTSSSSVLTRQARDWLASWAIALLVAAVLLGAVEGYGRARGYEPAPIDSPQLWSLQRERVYPTRQRPLVLLGASRTEYAIDMQRMKELLPGYRPVMLALNGLYPLATLRDLAADHQFSGIVLVDLEANAFLREYVDAQQPYVDYYHTRWTPSWRLHRRILTRWQQRALLANPEFGALAMLRRVFQGGEPFRPYMLYHADRSGDIDYTKTDPEAAKKHFAATVEGNIAHLPPHTPEEWLAQADRVLDWARAIRARGGQVIFYESPTHGLQREAMDRVYPRAQYWDRFAARSPAPVLAARDVPALDAFPLPDDSHLDWRDKRAYTEALVQALRDRDLLPKER